MAFLQFLKARLNERSTYAFWLAGLGAVAALSEPFNWVGLGVLFVAGMVPDGQIKGGDNA